VLSLHSVQRSRRCRQLDGVSVRCGWPVRTLTGCVPVPVMVGATRCGGCCLSFVKPLVAGRVGGSGDMPVARATYTPADASADERQALAAWCCGPILTRQHAHDPPRSLWCAS
jgi:hypothetical protein